MVCIQWLDDESVDIENCFPKKPISKSLWLIDPPTDSTFFKQHKYISAHSILFEHLMIAIKKRKGKWIVKAYTYKREMEGGIELGDFWKRVHSKLGEKVQVSLKKKGFET